MRCLSLARMLAAHGTEIAFASSDGSVELVPALERSGFPVLTARSAADFDLPGHWGGAADAIFVDLYTSTAADETQMREIAPVIAVIEDLPERPHDCDLLVDQGFDRTATSYAARVPAGTILLLGPDMAPLRPDFAGLRSASLARRAAAPGLSRLLISMGLTDVGGISARLAALARASLPGLPIDVILGPRATSLPALHQAARADPALNVLVDVDNMAERMMAADLAIGAGGGSALERCVLGVPSIVVVLADNQRPAARALESAGAVLSIESPDMLATDLPRMLDRLTAERLAHMSACSARLCDGRGAARIADALIALIGRTA
jgi:UDP-2,4-diacetamido-2,4,6-trideoxy-beta-L-altropyranose hydrolase